MNPEQKLAGLLNVTIQNQDGLAVWFLPGNPQINLISAEKKDIFTFSHPNEISQQSGFVFAPFQTNEFAKPVFLKSSDVVQTIEDFKISGTKKFHLPGYDEGIFSAISQEQYMEKCNAVIREIKSGKADKVVFSRVIIHKPKHQKHPAKVFLDIKSKYPEAFCYLFFTPQTGLWMGATPETLLTQKSGFIKTMALAGTRPVSEQGSKPKPWPEKELEEQKFVTDYINNALSELGIPDIKISKPYTAPAGKIEHIRTDIVITTLGTDTIPGDIIQALHPTPAVCGLPKKAALDIIRKTEDHQRTYYTGYLGPVNNGAEINLYVNLRCMKVHIDGFTIFAGGGITADSDARREWEETEMKASVMKNVIDTD